jgi:hypothetical protein
MTGSDAQGQGGPADASLSFEREKWIAEHALQLEELKLKTQQQDLLKSELALKESEAKRARWSSPLVLAVLGTALAALGNAGVTWINGRDQRTLEDTRATAAQHIQDNNNRAQLTLEEFKADSGRILEVIKTNDPDKAAVNLKFLLDSGLVSSARTSQNLNTYLAKRAAGEGPSLPAVAQDNVPLPTACPFDATQLSAKELLSKFETSIEDDQLEQLTRQVRSLTTTPLSNNQVSALVSFGYNVGMGNLRVSVILKSINGHDFAKAADGFLMWNRSSGQRLAGLHTRRLCERDLFVSQ